MLELTLAPHTEAVADPTAEDYERLKTASFGRDPLYHQWRTYHALKQTEIVVNSYNTGTGKTQAALLHLLDLADDYEQNKSRYQANVLFIAPTNELLRQHAADVEKFIAHNDRIPHEVMRLDASAIRELGKAHMAGNYKRSSDALEKILKNPSSFMKDSDGNHPDGKSPYILVVNPDIFYYALYGLGNPHERNLLFHHFVNTFNYIIVDEFHYYNAKQLANFLFFLTLLREWRYFGQEKRRVCLLTATPNADVEGYLRRLQSGSDIKIEYIEPGTEPAGLKRLPALAPLRLRLYSAEEYDQGIVDLAVGAKQTVNEWLDQGRHGAIISSALWRINTIYARYGGRDNERMERLTGPQRKVGRERARIVELMLATPTVDIGYNFERKGKARQSIDFLLFDGQYADEFTQRLGRAGRVLGKEVSDTPSDAWAIVPDKLVAELKPFADKQLTRVELSAIVKQTLAPRNGIYGYVRSGAIAEAFLPIYRYQQSIPTADAEQAESLFEAVKQTYGATDQWTFRRLKGEIAYYLKVSELIERVMRDAGARPFRVGAASVTLRYITEELSGDRMDENSATEPEGVEEIAQTAERAFSKKIEKRSAFIASRWEDIERYYVIKARFNFRDSYQPPQALIYDPQHLLSSEDYNLYSAIHVAQNCEADWSHDATRIEEWKAQLGWVPNEEIANCCAVKALLERRVNLRFSLDDPGKTKAEWENRYLSKLSALRGFRLLPSLDSGGKVPAELNDLFAANYFTFYAVPDIGPEARALNSLQRTTALFTNKLTVDFGDEGEATYLVVVGTAALLVASERTIGNAKHVAHREADGAVIW